MAQARVLQSDSTQSVVLLVFHAMGGWMSPVPVECIFKLRQGHIVPFYVNAMWLATLVTTMGTFSYCTMRATFLKLNPCCPNKKIKVKSKDDFIYVNVC